MKAFRQLNAGARATQVIRILSYVHIFDYFWLLNGKTMIRHLLHLFITLIALSIFPAAGTSQTIFWAEDFGDPEGWTTEANWTIEGGVLQFSWDPTIYNFDKLAVSPLIMLDSNVTELVVTQSLLIYNPTENEQAQVIISTQEDDFVVWDYSLANGNWGNSSGSELTISLDDFKGQTVQVIFRTYGETTFNWTSWQVFEAAIHATYNYDLMVTNISGPKKVELLQSGDWLVEVANRGAEPMNGYVVNLVDAKSGSIVDQVTESNTLQPGDTEVYGFSWTPNAAYNTAMYGKVVAAGDQFTGNDLSKGVFLRIEPDIDYSILVWDNDNGIQSIICPEYGDLVTPITGLTRALNDAGLDYDLYSYLPQNLEDYDIVIATLGNYCLS